MQAITISGDLAGGGFLDGVGRPVLRLSTRVPLSIMPVLTTLSRMGMGGAVGMMAAAFAGNGVFWVGLGIALGVAMDAVASRAPAAQPQDPEAPAPGPYRVR